MFKKIPKASLQKLIDNFILEKAKKCIKCGEDAKISLHDANTVLCTWKGCKYRYNLWKGTLFHSYKMPIMKMLRVIELWMQKASNKLISYITGLKRKAIWRIFNKLSETLVTDYNLSFKKIGGKSIIIEVDESKFGNRKYNREHSVQGVWILGMVERTPERKICLIRIDDRKMSTLDMYLETNVSSDSVIYSDCRKEYNNCIKKFAEHFKVNHSQTFKDQETECHTNTIEGN